MYCCSHNTIERNQQTVSIQLIDQINSKYLFTEDDFFVITGGEPTISPTFVDIITYISAYSKHIILYTNGRLLSQYSSSFLRKIERIIIPIYGNESQHDKYVCAENAFAETMRSIDVVNKIDPDLLEIKFVIGNMRNLEALSAFAERKDILQTRHISIDKLITRNKEMNFDDNLLLAVEKLIVKLHHSGKAVKFYDWPLCHFSKDFLLNIEKCYSKQDNISFLIICCPTNHVPFIYEFNAKARFFQKCSECNKSLFCSQIMRRYYCPVWDGDKCWIGTE